MRRQRGKIGNLAMIAVIFCIGYAGYLFGPPHWDYKMMRKICRDAVLTYRVSGSLKSAQQKYDKGLVDENIPYYIKGRDCHLRETKSDFNIECDWVAPITIPVLDIDMSKVYHFRTSIDRNGVVEEF